MFCPRCSQEQITEETRFCSRCGFLMTGVSELLASNGNLPAISAASNDKISPRKKGLKQGGVMLILGTFIIPLMAVTKAPGDMVAGMSIVFFLGGVLRMIYAMLFQSNLPQDKSLTKSILGQAQNFLPKKSDKNALPGSQTIPAADYISPNAGNWRNTNDLTAHSVVDNTTKLLNKDQ